MRLIQGARLVGLTGGQRDTWTRTQVGRFELIERVEAPACTHTYARTHTHTRTGQVQLDKETLASPMLPPSVSASLRVSLYNRKAQQPSVL